MSVRADVFDVIVVGAGPAGSSAAIGLAQEGARVLLVEREKFPRAKLCGEFISPECAGHFARLGVGGGMIEAGAREVVETVFYARSGRSVAVPSVWFGKTNVEGLGGAAMGLSRAEMDEQLMRRARAVGVEVWEGVQAAGLLCEAGRVRGVRLKGYGEAARASEVREARSLVIVDATGRSRALARQLDHERLDLNVGRRGLNFGKRASHHQHERHASLRRRPALVAFKAHLEGARGGERSCEIYFYRGGYGGLSPVEGGRSNLCFIVRAEDVRARGGDAERVLREVVRSNARARETLEGARVCSAWLSVALEGFGRREPASSAGLLAAGDAASFIDPFTGSGMLMALESGELVSQMLARRLPALREAGGRRGEEVYASLAGQYGALYEARFGSRLRVCSYLRRAAFAPPALAEAAVVALGASERVRRALARATRPSARERLGLNVE